MMPGGGDDPTADLDNKPLCIKAEADTCASTCVAAPHMSKCCNLGPTQIAPNKHMFRLCFMFSHRKGQFRVETSDMPLPWSHMRLLGMKSRDSLRALAQGSKIQPQAIRGLTPRLTQWRPSKTPPLRWCPWIPREFLWMPLDSGFLKAHEVPYDAIWTRHTCTVACQEYRAASTSAIRVCLWHNTAVLRTKCICASAKSKHGTRL